MSTDLQDKILQGQEHGKNAVWLVGLLILLQSSFCSVGGAIRHKNAAKISLAVVRAGMCGTRKFYSNKISFYASLDVKKEKSAQASNGSPCKEGYVSSDDHTEDNIHKQ